jgi:acetylglutamate kinase
VNVRVVKVGGAALADPSWVASFAAAAAVSTVPMVVVHGGGPGITSLSERLGIGFTWFQGRRVTSEAALDVAGMVLNGRVNKELVAALVAAGVDALGLSGIDGGLLRAETVQGGALGRVGRVTSVRTALLESLLAAGHTIVLSPISLGEDERPLNVNADDAAAAVATALHATELVFLTDVAGVLEGGVVRQSLDVAAAEALVRTGVATGGMAVKIGAGLEALAAGVRGVRIGDPSVLFDEGAGTWLAAAAAAATTGAA